jgi:hypothetical protein
MINEKQSQARRMKMAERAQQKMDLHFPGWPEFWVWNRKRDAGFISVPRILPIAMQAIDNHATKGSPGGHTLFCLWARSPDHVLVTIEHPATFAAEAGFIGKRAVDTWRKRMKVLRDLGFIIPKKGPSGDFHHVLLISPIAGVERMYQNGQVHLDLYDRFLGRLADTGAYGQLEAFKAAWQAEREATLAAAGAAAAPPPPPAPSSPAAIAPPPPSSSAPAAPPPAMGHTPSG